MKKICIYSDIEVNDIISNICDQLNHEELFEVIKNIDLTVADWDFTETLFKYFKCEYEKLLEEEKGMLNRSIA